LHDSTSNRHCGLKQECVRSQALLGLSKAMHIHTGRIWLPCKACTSVLLQPCTPSSAAPLPSLKVGFAEVGYKHMPATCAQHTSICPAHYPTLPTPAAERPLQFSVPFGVQDLSNAWKESADHVQNSTLTERGAPCSSKPAGVVATTHHVALCLIHAIPAPATHHNRK
jgi:hypothetical protein